MKLNFKYFFTITAGRTGTAWLAEFLGLNLRTKAIHEPLGIDDLGKNMPDIKIMRSFNERGNDDLVRDFWSAKLARISDEQLYVETNHTLAKCGLIENLASSSIAKDTLLIVLRRNKVEQCLSYMARGDFTHVTLEWQWYLHPLYANNIGNSKEFLALGPLGRALWYTYEMDARQEYYLSRFSGDLNFIDVTLEEITTKDGATKFLNQLGWQGEANLPPPRNQNKNKHNEALVERVTRLVQQVDYDPKVVVRQYLNSGRELGKTSV